MGEGTVRRGSATCPICAYTTPVASVRRQLAQRQGGTSDARLYAVVIARPDKSGRFYRLPTDRDLESARRAARELAQRMRAHVGAFALTPTEPLPPQGTLGFRVQLYGMKEWSDLYTPRQLLALTAPYIVVPGTVNSTRLILVEHSNGVLTQAAMLIHHLLSVMMELFISVM